MSKKTNLEYLFELDKESKRFNITADKLNSIHTLDFLQRTESELDIALVDKKSKWTPSVASDAFKIQMSVDANVFRVFASQRTMADSSQRSISFCLRPEQKNEMVGKK